MRPYVKWWDRDAPHPDGKPTPKKVRCRAAKKGARRLGKAAAKAAAKSED